jgi:TATA-binding protein-associated factor
MFSDMFNTNQRSVAITSYNLLSIMIEDFSLGEWDYVILDEGHTIKNPKTKMSQAAQALRSKHRLLLTGFFLIDDSLILIGTPIQNNLMELYTLVSWATNGTSLLGTKKDFNLKFVFPIEDGQNPNVSQFSHLC